MRSYLTVDIPLRGAGLTEPKAGIFKPGEFGLFQNVDMVPDGVRSRRSSKATGYTVANRRLGFAGHFGPDASGFNEIIMSTDYETSPLNSQIPQAVARISDTVVTTDIVNYGNGIASIVHAFKYNKFKYWLSFNHADIGAGDFQTNGRLTLYRKDELGVTVSVPLPWTVPAPNLPVSPDDQGFHGAFMYKDRYFLATNNSLYWSKATDPQEFDVPDGGGFIKFPGGTIKHIFLHRDTIYIITATSIYALTYNLDPGDDGTVTTVVPFKGGLYGASIRGIPYISCDDGLYTLDNGYLNFVADTNQPNTVGTVYQKHKIVEFEDTILILKSQGRWTVNSTMVSKLYAINIETGGLSDYILSNEFNTSYISDMFVSLEPNGNNRIFFNISNGQPGAGTYEFHSTSVYYMDADRNNVNNKSGTDGRNTLTSVNINWIISIESFLVDGNDWTFKKYRTLLLAGRFNQNAASHIKETLWDTTERRYLHTSRDFGYQADGIDETETRDPRQYRANITSRGRSFTLMIRTKPPQDGLSSAFYMNYLKILYTPTNRNVTHKEMVDQTT